MRANEKGGNSRVVAHGAWHMEKMLLHKNGRAEVVLSDGSALIIHPRAERLTYFRPDGARQRLLSSCVPFQCSLDKQASGDEVRGKTLAAFALRNRFYHLPVIHAHLTEGGHCVERHIPLAQVRWPCPQPSVIQRCLLQMLGSFIN